MTDIDTTLTMVAACVILQNICEISGDAYAYDEEWLTDQDNSLHDDNGKQRPLEQTTGSMIRHASKRHPVNNPLV